jgi:hypothetical protein
MTVKAEYNPNCSELEYKKILKENLAKLIHLGEKNVEIDIRGLPNGNVLAEFTVIEYK